MGEKETYVGGIWTRRVGVSRVFIGGVFIGGVCRGATAMIAPCPWVYVFVGVCVRGCVFRGRAMIACVSRVRVRKTGINWSCVRGFMCSWVRVFVGSGDDCAGVADAGIQGGGRRR